MRLVEIEVGLTYSDGRGATRIVIEEGPHLATNREQRNLDLVRYRVVTRGRGPLAADTEQVCTRQTFATWAVHEVMPEAIAA